MKLPKTILKKLVLFALVFGTVASLSGCQVLYITYRETPAAETAAAATEETRDLSVLPEQKNAEGSDPSEIGLAYDKMSEVVSTLKAEDYSGTTFMVLVATEASNTFLKDETEPFFIEYSKRNSLVSDYYKNSYFFSSEPLSQIKTDISNSKKSGDSQNYVADILEIPAKDAAALETAGLLLNLRQLPFYSLAKEGIAAAGLFNSTQSYFDCSRITDNPANYLCLYFNRSAFDKETVSSLYTAALEGEFTFEYFLDCVKDATPASDGYDICLSFDKSLLGELAFIRSGFRYTSIQSGYNVIDSSLENTSNLESLISQLCETNVFATVPQATNPSAVSSSSNSEDVKSAKDIFAAGKSTFFVGTVSDLVSLSSSKADWGVLPLPSGSGEYYNVESNRSVICVPVTNTRLELTGNMLNAFDAVSTDWMGRDFARTAIVNYLRDSQSYYTLLRVFENRSFIDFSYMYGSKIKNLANSTYGAVEKFTTEGVSISTTVSEYQKTVDTAIKKLK